MNFIFFNILKKEFSDSLNIQYIETSAKDSNNVEQAFRMMINENILSTLTSNTNDIKRVESPILSD